jgi:catechol 2,3-dioxygenase-like lactoylglutathione lyase family enzyme
MSHDAFSSARPYAVTLSVPNLDEGVAWYTTKLGLKLVASKDYPEFGTRLAFMALNGWRVELIEDSHAAPAPTRPDPPRHTATHGISQFSFQIDDLAAVKAELISREVPIVWEFENAELGARFLFIRDPYGNLIQYLQHL